MNRKPLTTYNKGDTAIIHNRLYECVVSGQTSSLPTANIAEAPLVSDNAAGYDGGVIWLLKIIRECVPICLTDTKYWQGDKVRFKFKDSSYNNSVYECIVSGVVRRTEISSPISRITTGTSQWILVGQTLDDAEQTLDDAEQTPVLKIKTQIGHQAWKKWKEPPVSKRKNQAEHQAWEDQSVNFHRTNEVYVPGELVFMNQKVYKCVMGGLSASTVNKLYFRNDPIYVKDGDVYWEQNLIHQQVPAAYPDECYKPGDLARFSFDDSSHNRLVYKCTQQGEKTVTHWSMPAINLHGGAGRTRWTIVGQQTDEANTTVRPTITKEGKTMNLKDTLSQDRTDIADAIFAGVKQGLASTVSEELRACIQKSLGSAYPQSLKESALGQALEAVFLPILIRELSILVQNTAPDVVNKAREVCDLALTQAVAEHSKEISSAILPLLTQISTIEGVR